MLVLSSLILLAHFGAVHTAPLSESSCASYKAAVAAANGTIQGEFNTTILDVTYVGAGANISTPGSCQSSAVAGSAMCRVQAVIHTTSSSEVHFEAWLPDQWFGRFVSLGNGGLGGCIDYSTLAYGTSLNFASFASDNGHDGNSGTVFLNAPEVINDFAFRAIHAMTAVGKDITATYYGTPPARSYYAGCSTGGRQGLQSALRFPDDFDGIIAGSPAADWNHLTGDGVLAARLVGAPTDTPLIPAEAWPLISQEILNQCDGIDGVVDGVITDPNLCDFKPEALMTAGVLNATQVYVLHQIYSPTFGTHGELLFPQYDLAAEADGQWTNIFSGSVNSISRDWYRYAIFNDSTVTFENFTAADVEFADTINPGGIRTFSGDFSAFRATGGKLLSYHGRRDQLIASTNSLRLYDLIRTTLSLPTLDDFYRLFLVPGMEHCAEGPGAWDFGQGFPSPVNDSSHNILLALVDWVESGQPPDVIVGTNPFTGAVRTHCRYPHPSVWNGTEYVCE